MIKITIFIDILSY